MLDASYTFVGELWEHQPEGPTWVLVTVPVEDSDEIRERVPTRVGFGSVRVRARIGDTSWKTSVFPSAESGCYVLPLKKDVRRAEGLETGDAAEVTIELLEE